MNINKPIPLGYMISPTYALLPKIRTEVFLSQISLFTHLPMLIKSFINNIINQTEAPA